LLLSDDQPLAVHSVGGRAAELPIRYRLKQPGPDGHKPEFAVLAEPEHDQPEFAEPEHGHKLEFIELELSPGVPERFRR
jgi:hypothetical protein